MFLSFISHVTLKRPVITVIMVFYHLSLCTSVKFTLIQVMVMFLSSTLFSQVVQWHWMLETFRRVNVLHGFFLSQISGSSVAHDGIWWHWSHLRPDSFKVLQGTLKSSHLPSPKINICWNSEHKLQHFLWKEKIIQFLIYKKLLLPWFQTAVEKIHRKKLPRCPLRSSETPSRVKC